MLQDIGAYDMIYDEFEEIVRKAWSEKINYLFIEKTKKNKGKHRFFNENKNTYIDCFCESEPFQKNECCSQSKTDEN